jgi:hypothetical protein
MPEELIPIALFVCIAAVMIFRPLTKRIGLILEAIYQERRRPAERPDLAHLTRLLERVSDRMDGIEDRLDFTERMLEANGSHGSGSPQNGSHGPVTRATP